jgi:putative membrane protein
MGACGMGWFGMIMMLLFWALVIAGIVFLIQKLVRSSGDKTSRSNKGADSNAMDILKERYARGEITQDEFEAMKKEILK